MTRGAGALLLLAVACPGGRGPIAGNGRGSATGTEVRTPDAAGPAPALDAPPPEKVVQLNATGELVDVEAALVPGYVTIVDFWAEWCGACKVMEEKFMSVIGDEPRVLVRKVDVGDGDTPVAEHYDIGPLPHLRVYDGGGELRYVLVNNQALEAGEKALEVLRGEAKE